MAITAQNMRTGARAASFGARPDSFRADAYRPDPYRPGPARTDDGGGAASVSLALGAAAAGGAILGILMALLAAWLF